eukprot:3199851-Prymnesium_polylepis.2
MRYQAGGSSLTVCHSGSSGVALDSRLTLAGKNAFSKSACTASGSNTPEARRARPFVRASRIGSSGAGDAATASPSARERFWRPEEAMAAERGATPERNGDAKTCVNAYGGVDPSRGRQRGVGSAHQPSETGLIAR